MGVDLNKAFKSGGLTKYTPNTPNRVNGKKITYVTPKPVNIKKAISTGGLSTPASRNQAVIDQAKRIRARDIQIARQQAIVKRRLTDAKKKEISNIQTGFRGKLWDKATFGQSRRERGSRETAVQYYHENEQYWGSAIENRQKNYQNKGAKLKDWVLQANSEGEYKRRVREANAWLDREYKLIGRDINDYNKSQKELAVHSEKPLTGGLAKVAGKFKKVVGNVAGTSFNALTWTTSQPQRVLNTAKNVIKPNNLRQYYGGDEKKGGIDAKGWKDKLKNAYNASRDQRIVGFSKQDEKERLAGWTKKIRVKTKNGWETRKVTRTPSWLDRTRVKYGDDVVDMMLDPMSIAPNGWGGKLSKGAGGLAFKGLRRSKQFRNFAISATAIKQMAKHSRFGKAGKWLNKEFTPRGERARQAVNLLNEDLSKTQKAFRKEKGYIYKRFGSVKSGMATKRGDFIRDQIQTNQRLEARADVFKRQHERLTQDFVKRLEDFSESEVRHLTQYARNGKWTVGGKLGINKYRKKELTSFLEDYQVRAKEIADAERLQNRAKNYLPEFTGKNYDSSKSRKLFGTNYHGQGKQQLQESIIMREFTSDYDQSSSFLQQLKATEKSILKNAQKNRRSLSVYEQEQLQNIERQRNAIGKLTKRYESKFGHIRSAIEKTRESARPAIKWSRRGGLQTNFTKQGLKNTGADLFRLPQSVWRKSVLKYNPAWYVNNMAWNIPASISGGGAGVFDEYKKLLTNAKYRNQMAKSLPEGVRSKINREIGNAGLASKIEDTSRTATFLALKKAGKSDDEALKITNRWLFDYTTKNWERPIKAVLPFWQWQKNLLKLGAQMPFTNPRSAKAYSETYKKFYQRPYDQLPSEVQEYTDPDTGKKVTYDPRKFYKGKAKIGDNFYGLPFFAVNPETMLQFGVNPYLTAGADYMTSSDRLGNPNTDRKGWSILGERFPQINLARNFLNRNKKRATKYFSESGNSKSQQGYDESKPNYDKSLDNRVKFKNNAKSFFGIPRGVKFDRGEYETKKRLTAFNKEFFAKDWEKLEDKDYDKAQAQKEKLAKKYGFDLKKDIYDNYWSKYDTPTTKRTKALKEKAHRFNTRYWDEWYSKKAGIKGVRKSERPAYFIKKFEEWRKNHTFADNVYYKIPQLSTYDKSGNKGKKEYVNPFTLRNKEAETNARVAEGKRKYQRYLEYQKAKKTGDWSWFEKNGTGLSDKAKSYRLARKSGDWSAFNAQYGDKRKSSPYKFDGKYFKSAQSMKRFQQGSFWKKYYEAGSLKEKQELLKANPQFQTFKQPTTQAEWDAVRKKMRTNFRKRAGKVKGFNISREKQIKMIKKGLPANFGRSYKLKYK
jgi:hypothetical protein